MGGEDYRPTPGPGRRFAAGSTRGDHLTGAWNQAAYGFAAVWVGLWLARRLPPEVWPWFAWPCLLGALVLLGARLAWIGDAGIRESFAAVMGAWFDRSDAKRPFSICPTDEEGEHSPAAAQPVCRTVGLSDRAPNADSGRSLGWVIRSPETGRFLHRHSLGYAWVDGYVYAYRWQARTEAEKVINTVCPGCELVELIEARGVGPDEGEG